MDDYQHLTAEELYRIYHAYKGRFDERSARHDLIDQILRKEFNLEDDSGDKIPVRSPNLVDIAVTDIAEASSAMPTLRVRPIDPDEPLLAIADTMSKVGRSYLEANALELLVKRIVYDISVYGLSPVIVQPNLEDGRVELVRRDPRTCYPEPGIRPGDFPKRVVFAYAATLGSLDDAWIEICRADYNSKFSEALELDRKVTVVEYIDKFEHTTGVLVSTGQNVTKAATVAWTPVIVDSIPNLLEVCPVYVFDRLTWDSEHRGFADDVIDTLIAHAELISLVIEYADQSVYSDIWARDVIGDVNTGGAGMIQLGPNGAIGRIPPANMSLDLWRSIEALENMFHLGMRWPKSRTGEIDQAIASGKFVESTVAMLNTVIRTMHQVLQRGLGALVRVSFAVDKEYFAGTSHVATGALRNQEFIVKYDPADFALDEVVVTVEYGLGLGKSVEQSAILMLQYMKEGLISLDFVQENIEGIRDIALERERIDTRDFQKMMKAKLMQSVEAGEITAQQLTEAYRMREKGDTWVEVFEMLFPPEPEPEEMMEGDPLAGLDPGLAGMLGGMGGPGGGGPGKLPMPPPPPDAVEMLSRATAPAGPGGVIGTQIQG